ncbi:endonuclease III-like protein 1 [Tachysurus ichikawai]
MIVLLLLVRFLPSTVNQLMVHRDLGKGGQPETEELIKVKYLKQATEKIHRKFGDGIPDTLEGLVHLPELALRWRT